MRETSFASTPTPLLSLFLLLSALVRRLPPGGPAPPPTGDRARARARQQRGGSAAVKRKKTDSMPGLAARLRARTPSRKAEAASPSGNLVALVTGGSGFLGRHLVAALAGSGDYARVVVFDVRPSPDARAESIVGDLRDSASVAAAFKGAGRKGRDGEGRDGSAGFARPPTPSPPLLLQASTSSSTAPPRPSPRPTRRRKP